MDNEDEAQKFLAGFGWQCGSEPHMDHRSVHPLAVITPLSASDKGGIPRVLPPRPRSRQEVPLARARRSTIQLTRQLDRLTISFRTVPGTAPSETFERDRAELLEKQEERIRRFNSLGVFKPSVSVVRARALYHVELARRLKNANLTKRLTPRADSAAEREAYAAAAAAAQPPAPGLHNKLNRILGDVALSSSQTRRLTRGRRTGSRRLTRQKTALKSQPSELELLTQERTRELVQRVHARTEEAARAAAAETVTRYRARVEKTKSEALARAAAARLARFAQNYSPNKVDTSDRLKGAENGVDGERNGDAAAAQRKGLGVSGTEGDVGTESGPFLEPEDSEEREYQSDDSENRARMRSSHEGEISERPDGRFSSASRGRQKEEETSDERRRTEAGGAAAGEADAAAELSEQALLLAQSAERVAALRRNRRETDTGTTLAPCYRTRTAQAWAALEQTLTSVRSARITECEYPGGIEGPEDSGELIPDRNGVESGDEFRGEIDGDWDSDELTENENGEKVVPPENGRNHQSAGTSLQEGVSAEDAAATLQARLERVWEVLDMPTSAKVDMVIKYTSRGGTCHLEDALRCWEGAAAAVLAHESALKVWECTYAAAYKASDASTEERHVDEQIRVARAVVETAASVNKAIQALRTAFGDELLVHGERYDSQLQQASSAEATLEGLQRRKTELRNVC